jgi:hypothetical protein
MGVGTVSSIGAGLEQAGSKSVAVALLQYVETPRKLWERKKKERLLK